MPPKISNDEMQAPFEIRVSVEAADIDELNHVNNIVYLRWAQDAAVAHWQAVASQKDQRAIVWVVLRHEIDYKSAAFLGDEILVKTRVGTASGLTFERHTEILRARDGVLLARGRTLWCPLSTETGRPKRVDESLRAQFST
jgi:acyl-CoA thioester hydrolase